MSCMHTGEVEIWEWTMARTFNYAKMAALIAPHLFMLRRGHRDCVGLDEEPPDAQDTKRAFHSGRGSQQWSFLPKNR
jgi:hypothetical protein